ncbi:hypothetical protein NH340_JMT04808 [Sarcoptes scabiei]|nr:hypothetical protein NH340_JMT04808 [Sarcoptes scabiei]
MMTNCKKYIDRSTSSKVTLMKMVLRKKNAIIFFASSMIIALIISSNRIECFPTVSNDTQMSANQPNQAIDKNTNVYGLDSNNAKNGVGGGGGSNQQQQQNNPQSVNRGFNQGYSYNTGIKPYRTGYTYFQPFGDAVTEQTPTNQNNQNGIKGVNSNNNNQNDGANNNDGKVQTVQQLPVQLPDFFGIDPKQLGPVRVISNKNLPLDENGIPILDAIHIPENANEENANNNNNQQQQQQTLPQAPPTPVDVPVNANDFTGDFNFNNILSGTDGTTGQNGGNYNNNNNNNNNGNSLFDFSPPSSNNFNFGGRNNNGGDESDPSLMLDNTMPSTMNGNNRNQNQSPQGIPSDALSGFGFDGQQVPSEIVNLNNAFGTGMGNNNNANNANTRNGNNLNDILNQFSTNGGGGNPNVNDMGDFGNFGSSSNGNPLFPFL